MNLYVHFVSLRQSDNNNGAPKKKKLVSHNSQSVSLVIIPSFSLVKNKTIFPISKSHAVQASIVLHVCHIPIADPPDANYTILFPFYYYYYSYYFEETSSQVQHQSAPLSLFCFSYIGHQNNWVY